VGQLGLSMDGPAAYLLGVMPYLERSRATKPPWTMPTEQMLVIRRATVLSARMPLRLGDAVLDSAVLHGALTAGRIRRGRGGGLRRFARSRPLDRIRLRRTRGHVRRRVMWASRRPPAVASRQVEFVVAVCFVGS